MTEIKGILGEKLGMTQIFQETRAVPVTVIKAGPCFVAQVKTKETDGYDAVQLAFTEPRRGAVTKPMQGHFDAHGGQPGRHVVELRTDDASSYAPGQEIRADAEHVGTGSVAWAPRTALSASTDRPARSAPAPRRAACSRACAWPATRGTSASPC